MSDDRCPHIERCELFPTLRLGTSLGYCLETYCYGDHSRCARFRFVQREGKRPPEGLLPNGALDE